MQIADSIYRFFSSKILFLVFFGLLSLLAVTIAAFSFKWALGLDNNPLLYAAFLTDEFNMIPYRDFFYMHFPGVHLYYLIIGKAFGFTNLGFRAADMVFTSIMFLCTFFLLRKFSWKAAWSGSVLFLLLYLIGKDTYAMQRDYVLLMPIILAILVTVYFPKLSANLKLFIAGFFCSITMLIKPQEALIYPVMFVFQIWFFGTLQFSPFPLKKIMTSAFVSFSGFLIPLSCAFLYLWFADSLKLFTDAFLYFHPVYRTLHLPAGNLFVPAPESFSFYVNEHLKFGYQRLMIIPATVGIYIALYRSALQHFQKKIVYLFISLAMIFNINVALAYKYCTDHWLQFFFCLTFFSSLCFINPDGFKKYRMAGRIGALLVIYVFTVIRLFQNIENITTELRFESYTNQTSERIADATAFLKQNIKPGEKILTLDVLGYSLNSLMLAKARQATYHISPWYLNIPEISGNPYFSRQRTEFLQQMRDEKPRFIIDFDGYQWFNDFQNILDTEYVKVPDKDYLIYSRSEKKVISSTQNK